jgi:hypothetical protein
MPTLDTRNRAVNPSERPAGVPRLDRGTLLVTGAVRVNLYGTAGEASIWLDSGPSTAPDIDRQAEPPEANRERAVRRARSTSRRYVKGNQLGTIITLTYADQHDDRRRVYHDMAGFEREWNARYPARPWLWVIERHKSGRFHVHFVTTGQYRNERRTRAIADLWGHGFVDVGKPAAPSKAAAYAAKYLAKDMGETDAGDHSYESRQGFRVTPLEVVFPTLDAAFDALIAFFAAGPAAIWSSASLEGSYRGPPAWLAFFD